MTEPLKVAGVYVIEGPAGVYVGQSTDCYARNAASEKLGLAWGIVRELPGADKAERMRAETEVADAWESRGFTVVSRNTTQSLSGQLQALHANTLGTKRSRETREKMSAANKKRTWRPTVEWRAKISASLRGRTPWNKGKSGYAK